MEGWSSLRTSFMYGFQDSFRIVQNLVVPEPEDRESTLRKNGVSFQVFRSAFGMLSTIKLDYDTLCKTDEINNEMVDGLLPPEFYSC